MCVYEYESKSGRKMTFTQLRTFLRRRYHSHNIHYLLRKYLHGPQSCLLSPEKPCVFFPKNSVPSKNHLLKWNGQKQSIALNINAFNKCEKSTCEMVVTTLLSRQRECMRTAKIGPDLRLSSDHFTFFSQNTNITVSCNPH